MSKHPINLDARYGVSPLLSTGLTIIHIFLGPSGGQVRRTVRSRCDCADNVGTVRRTRVDENDSRGQCATHRSQTDLFRLMLCDRCDAQFHSPHLWVKPSHTWRRGARGEERPTYPR